MMTNLKIEWDKLELLNRRDTMLIDKKIVDLDNLTYEISVLLEKRMGVEEGDLLELNDLSGQLVDKFDKFVHGIENKRKDNE